MHWLFASFDSSIGSLNPQGPISVPFGFPGHSSESKSPLFNDTRNYRMLLCIHAASLNTSQLNCVFLWTFDGQGYGKFL